MKMAESGGGGGGDGDGNGSGERRRRSIVPVVYYLSRNRHLEHPHFIEVPLSSSSDAFFLRDFVERLNQVRGKGMAAMYSWSCKRGYKNGFVWHDLSEDDLILPANGNEYVLKGSELLDQSPPDRPNQSHTNPKPMSQTRPKQEGMNLSRHKSKEASPSSSASPPQVPIKHLKPISPLSLSSARDEEQSPSSLSSGPRSPDESEIKFHRPIPSADASTQTEEETVTKSRGVSTDDNRILNNALTDKHNSNCGKSETLESLIRAEGRKFSQLRVLEEDEEMVFTSGPRLSPASYLMHLITCGSISVKDHRRYGFVPVYRPSYMQVELPSPMYDGGSMRFLTRMEDKEYFSGSIVETKRHIDDSLGDRAPILKRSSSYNAERSCKSSEHLKDEMEDGDSSLSKCLPRTIKLITSPLSDCPRSSSAGPDVSQTTPAGARRITTTASPVVEPSKRNKEKLIKIEERLTSGARVVIQSRVPCDESEDGSDT
ncbi:UPSTREAM OF FLC protein (DUF966) [Rhynchospora pubera]|uniref:UPSTREAM OF FLC protein (DUF966) n=1 Tax=Rhynchospora pubera TaxID=906938 RepID=A0AAV8DQS9_9POAL|nr:UPSTREAM OF FLC protein (DUF966) [Rhynchospora pubera]